MCDVTAKPKAPAGDSGEATSFTRRAQGVGPLRTGASRLDGA